MSQVVTGPGCRNCGAELLGPFCQACGQKSSSTHLGMQDVMHEVTHELLHLDGRIFRTVKVLITRPGQLTRELVEGRRAHYVTPLRLYLTSSLLFFLVVAVLPGGTRSFLNVTRTTERRSAWTIETRPTAQAPQPADDGLDEGRREQIASRFMDNVPRAIFALMPAAALLTFLFYRRRQPYFVAHVYYSVHLHAFVFLVFTAAVLLSRAGTVGGALAAVMVIGIFPYHFAALRKFFGDSLGRTLWKGAAISLMYLIVLGVSMAGLMMVAVS